MPRGSRHLAEPALLRHRESGHERTVTTKTDLFTARADGYRTIEEIEGPLGEADITELVAEFDPSTKSVKDVNAYLAGNITDEERERVLQAEREGQNRATVAAPKPTESTPDSAE